MQIPVVYTGEKACDEPKILGCKLKFARGIPRHIDQRLANVLLNRKNYTTPDKSNLKNFSDPSAFIKTAYITRTLHSLGDMLYATPTPKAFKLKYPKAKVIMMVPQVSFPIWQYHPWVDQLIPSDTGQPITDEKCDAYFDITRPCVHYEHYSGNFPSQKSRIDIYMEHCGAQMPNEEKRPIYTITASEREAAAKDTRGRFFLGIQLRANSPDRNWQPGNQLRQDKNWAVLNRWLDTHSDIDVMIFDQHQSFTNTLPKHPRVHVCSGKGIRETMALLERCVLSFTLNSGMLVASGALSVPQVSLFGNINPSSRVPYLPNVKPIWYPEFCVHGKAPCWSTCGHAYCLDKVPVDVITNALEELYRGPAKERHEIMKKVLVKQNEEPIPSLA